MHDIQLSIIIPGFNRPSPLIDTLASARRLLTRLRCEILLIDDGSHPGLQHQLPPTALQNVRLISQSNAGSIVSRIHGLEQSRGAYVKFLDSDDLLDSDGVVHQVSFLEQSSAAAVYSDIKHPQQQSISRNTKRRVHIAEFALDIQPAPHAPMYRRSALIEAQLRLSPIPADHLFCATGDIWLYASILKNDWEIHYLPGYVGSVANHQHGRYSDCWERLGLVGGSILWCLAHLYSDNKLLREQIARKALNSLLMLPRGTPDPLEQLYHSTWSKLDPTNQLLPPKYRTLSRFIGFEWTLWLARIRRQKTYQQIRTMDEPNLLKLTTQLNQTLRDRDFSSPWKDAVHGR